jgi:hypothetical protein
MNDASIRATNWHHAAQALQPLELTLPSSALFLSLADSSTGSPTYSERCKATARIRAPLDVCTTPPFATPPSPRLLAREHADAGKRWRLPKAR